MRVFIFLCIYIYIFALEYGNRKLTVNDHSQANTNETTKKKRTNTSFSMSTNIPLIACSLYYFELQTCQTSRSSNEHFNFFHPSISIPIHFYGFYIKIFLRPTMPSTNIENKSSSIETLIIRDAH